MKVYLYTLIGEAIQEQPHRRTPLGLARNRARRALDLAQWLALGRFPFAFYNYEDRAHTNAGDIAIRVAIQQQLRRAFQPEPVEIEQVSWGDLDDDAVERINRDGDLLVLGGGYFHYGPDGRIKKPVPADAPRLERLRCPIAVYGAGANCKITPEWDGRRIPLDAESVAMLRRIARTATVLAVRDEYTQALFRDLGRPDTRAILDPAMLIEPSGPVPSLPDGLKVGLNLGFHGPHSQAVLGRNLEAYVGFLKQLRRECGCSFYYFLHSDGERLVPWLLRLSGVPVGVIRCAPAELPGYYAQMRIQVSHMMHSAILCMSAGTPAISLAYDVKNVALFRMLGLERYAASVFGLTAESLVRAARSLLAEREAVAAHLRARRAELAQENDRALADAVSAARQHHASRFSVACAR